MNNAHEYFVLASDRERANRVYEKYVLLARKVNLVSGREEVMKLSRIQKSAESTETLVIGRSPSEKSIND